MNSCISPPELADRQLLRHLDGNGDQAVSAHLKICPHCRERAVQLERWQGTLRRKLGRVDCPSSMEISAYLLGELDKTSRRSLAAHLKICPLCREEAAQFETFMERVDANPTNKTALADSVIVRIAQRLIGGMNIGWPDQASPVLAGARGGETESLLFQAGEVQIALQVLEDPDAPDKLSLLGLLAGVQPAGWQAFLWQAGDLLDTVPVDELGNFTLPEVTPGVYELILGDSEMEVHIQSLDCSGD